MNANPQTATPPDVADNASVAMLSKALYLVTRLCVPPLVLAHVSLADYGLWTACFVLIMYIGLSDAGFSNVYVRFSARYYAQGRVDAINRLLSTGVTLLAVTALAVLAALWLMLPTVLEFLKVDTLQREKAGILVMGSAAIFMLDLSLGAYCYLLHGLQRIREEQKVAMVGYLLELILIFAFLTAGFGVYALLLAFALRYLWSMLSFMRLAHRLLPGLQLHPRHFDRSMLRHFYGFGAAVQVSALLATALSSLDRMIAGALLGPKGIALFDLAAKLPVSALTVPSVISNVTLAAGAKHAAENNPLAVRELYLAATRATGLIAALPLAFIAAFAAPIGSAWLGNREGLEQLPLIMSLAALGAHMHIITGPGSAIFRARGKVANDFVYHGLRLVLLLAAVGTALLLAPSTTVGLAWGMAVGAAGAAALYLVHNQRQLGLPLRALLQQVLLPSTLAYAIAAMLRLAWDLLLPAAAGRWDTLAALLLCGMVYTAACLIAAWIWILSGPERLRLIELRAKLLGTLPRWRTS